MLKIAVLVSGGGTNLQAIIDAIESGYLSDCTITAVISSKRDVFALARAERHGIKAVCVPRKECVDLQEFEEKILAELEKSEAELIVYAGFLSILGETVLQKYKNKMINVHPALIPSFCGKGFYGLKPHEEAIKYGVKITGATVHFVDIEADTGPIILQKAVKIRTGDTPEILQKRVMEEAEQIILPKAIKLISEGKISIEGRIVITEDDIDD